MENIEKKINIDDIDLKLLLGLNDENLDILENHFNSNINIRGNLININGPADEVPIIEKVINELKYLIKKNGGLTSQDVISVIRLLEVNDNSENHEKSQNVRNSDIILHSAKGPIRARTPNQFEYYRAVQENDIVFAIGPAGTGKTYLAVAMAIASLRRNEVSKIVLSRPAVEAGESLGFLPGDLKEKIDPYIKPLTDALSEMLTPEKYHTLLDKEIIEITPLAYMRGRTLNYSFIILDEAQNATITQMKMFLTRLGVHSKAIVTGDITQIDLPDNSKSGLINANQILQEINGIKFVYFNEKDVVRHKLVADIIKAYEKDGKKLENS
ncbi:MAG TPA: PhoH family protein [Candidatus Kapabacteria bacterium]|jgi:phosphate starvation-inducible PhoH-like protein|nr:PhoH family protein [Candidatus Kapabacteria bacterium]